MANAVHESGQVTLEQLPESLRAGIELLERDTTVCTTVSVYTVCKDAHKRVYKGTHKRVQGKPQDTS